MLYIKDGFPEVKEYVFCKVEKIYGNSVFVNLLEYEKEGIINISEISPGRIRNMRDFVVEGKEIVCKVLKINGSVINLSLRRVSVLVKNNKVKEVKMENFCSNIYKEISKKLNTDYDSLLKKTLDNILEKYGSVFDYFNHLILNNEDIEELKNLNNNERKIFLEIILSKLKPEIFKITKKFSIKSFDEFGIEKIINCFDKIIENLNYKKVKLSYLSASNYELEIENKDKKECSKLIDYFFELLNNYSKEFNLIINKK